MCLRDLVAAIGIVDAQRVRRVGASHVALLGIRHLVAAAGR